MIKPILATLILSTAMFAQTAPAPASAATTVSSVTPKESVSSLKLQLDSQKFTGLQKDFNTAVASLYNDKFKSAVDSLNKEEADLVSTIKKENNWDDTYTFNQSTGTWFKGPASPHPVPPPADAKK